MKSDGNVNGHGSGRQEAWPSQFGTGTYANRTETATSDHSTANDELIDVGAEVIDQGALDPDTNP
ncbi:MAG: hypothetical protein M3R15_25090, partial [Acidobacteriota bacterium]|nr:hypothetical protein [Acidobacteriota bacterium]